jgi:hypothetical protein
VNLPVDKPTLREQLDAVRPDSDDLAADDLQEASRAVATSEQWQQTLARQEAFDRQVAVAMQTLDVPVGLQQRLLETLADARRQNADDTLRTAEPPVRPAHARRSILRWGTLAAALLLAAGTGWLLLPRDVDQLTLDQARQKLPVENGAIDISKLPTFDGSFEFPFPDRAWERTTSVSLKGLDWTGDDRHDAAIYEFSIGRRVHGYLLVLPADRISDPPNSTRVGTSNMGYQPVPNTAWINPRSHTVYICYVDQGDLPALQRLLYPLSA